ncbi:hypothetical protein PspLS_00963, partial [Pyricularia sp. CBS 133598]
AKEESNAKIVREKVSTMSGNEDGGFKPTWSFAGLGIATAASTTSCRSSRKPPGAGGGRSSPTPSVAPSQRTVASRSTHRTSQRSTAAASSSASTSTHKSRSKSGEDDDKTITNRRRPAAKQGNARECAVCTEEVAESEFPTKAVTSACNHPINTCKTCLKTSISSDMNNKFWNRISCPECGASLMQEDVERHAEPATIDKYRKLKENADRQASPNFRWCSAGCGAGQEHTGGPNQPMMICQQCNARSCFNHESRWHEGYTCRQWDKVTEPDDESMASTRSALTVARSEAPSSRGLSSAAFEASSRRPAPVAESTTSKRRDKSSAMPVAPLVAESAASSRRPPSSVASSRASVQSMTSKTTSTSTRSNVSGTSNLSRATSSTPSQNSSRAIRPALPSVASSASHAFRRTQGSSKTLRSGDASDRQLSERRLISIREEEEATNIKFSMELARRLQLDEDRVTARFYEDESLKTARQLAAEFATEEDASREQLSLGLARRLQEEWAAMDEEEREKSSASMARRLQDVEDASLVSTDFMIAQRLHQEEEARVRFNGQNWDPQLRGGGISLSRQRSPRHRRDSRVHIRDCESRHRSSRSGRDEERRHRHRRPSSLDNDRSHRRREREEREDPHDLRRLYEEQKQKEDRERRARKEEQLAVEKRCEDKEKEEREEAARKEEELRKQKRRELAAAVAEQERVQQTAAAELKNRREAARAERARMAAEQGISQPFPGTSQTYQQADAIQEAKRRRKEERASQAAIKLLSKPCPECKYDTFKAEGWALKGLLTRKFENSDHITCSACRHQWCWVCRSAWTDMGCSNLGCAGG